MVLIPHKYFGPLFDDTILFIIVKNEKSIALIQTTIVIIEMFFELRIPKGDKPWNKDKNVAYNKDSEFPSNKSDWGYL
jgi:hypothetical protein